MIELQRLKKQLIITTLLFFAMLLLGSSITWLVLNNLLNVGIALSLLITIILWLGIGAVASYFLVKLTIQPVASASRALEHIAVTKATQAPPVIEDIVFGKEIAQRMITDVYNIASGQHEGRQDILAHDEFMLTILNLLETPIFAIDSQNKIFFANSAALAILPESLTESPVGYEFDQLMHLHYTDGGTLNAWLETNRKDKVKEHKIWQRVQLDKNDGNKHYYDVVAAFNRGESHGLETLITLIDKTENYVSENNSVDFVSLAVHELRGPITVLKGYIEMFEDELATTLDAEQSELLTRMTASASQLSTFVNNILSVAKVENQQLKVHIEEEDWIKTLTNTVNELKPYVEARGRHIELITPEELPTVAVDRISIYEVISNLIDNAVKYSPDQDTIVVEASLAEDKTIQTTVTDNGIGVPASVIDHLFDKFYRSHRSRENVGGTGLGLFLCKAILEAHGGTIWVRSKEQEGATFGFNLKPFSAMTDTINENKPQIVRNSHGWIKNHGAIRR